MLPPFPYETQDEKLNFGHINLSLTTVTNIDALFDALIDKGENHADVQDERIPYWAELWASALALSEYLIENQSLIAQKNVLEIGAGLGLPSLLAHKLGAQRVVVTDYLDEALTFARHNFEKNIAPDSQNAAAEFMLLDWRETAHLAWADDQKADILLASDVAYESRAFAPLLQSFHNLCRTNGTIIITEPNRPVSKSFFSGLNTEGYAVSHFSKRITRRGHTFEVNIYVLRK